MRLKPGSYPQEVGSRQTWRWTCGGDLLSH